MSVVIFSGPSLPRWQVEQIEGFVWAPPVRQGDLYRAALEHPDAIGVVDGVFETTPTVWHKEILWALSEGIPVFGAASIGALRAVELAPFGMKGAGSIFEMFRSGELEDDDEIAVLHAPAELEYIPVTEAMVNVRATIALAVAENAVRPEDGTKIIRAAKALFYKERTWGAILSQSAPETTSTCEGLAAWLPDGRIDQKRIDGVAMLDRIQADLKESSALPQPCFIFSHTIAWEAFVRSVERS